MPRTALTLVALLTLGVMAPIRAQQHVVPVTVVATADLMVARLLSFDRNHDGVVTRDELPERMQGVLARGDVAKTDALDAAAIRRLAEHPATTRKVVAGGIQPGQYGFGDSTGLDTRLHLNGAIDDLRLASAVRNDALVIGARFLDRYDAEAKTTLIAAVTPLLNVEQLAAITDATDRPAPRVAPAVIGQNVPLFLDGTPATALVARARVTRPNDLTKIVGTFDLAPAQRHELDAAVQRFSERDRLTDEARASLLDEMRGVLTDQQRDDLRAALERRPIVKQAHVLSFVTFSTAPTAPAPAPPAPQFGMRDLVLR